MNDYLLHCQARVNKALDRLLPPASDRFSEALRYATLAPGKRLRPAFVYAVGDTLGADPSPLDHFAVAVECIHAYSLVHDDLPALDDDDLRRGRPTTHKAYDEATAILVGDALQPFAFECILTAPRTTDHARSQAALTLAQAIGPAGMVLGQVLDIAAEKNPSQTQAEMERLHGLKTGRLIEAALCLGWHAKGDSNPDELRTLAQVGRNLGLAFQIQDDVLEATSDCQTLGKGLSDERHQKSTYPRLLGIEASNALAQRCIDDALTHLAQLPHDFERLRELAVYVTQRVY